MIHPTTVKVPGSSANLGPGFDSLGVALSLYLTCKFEAAEKTAITVSGRDSHLIPANNTNLIVTVAQTVATRCNKELPPFHLDINNDIPLGKGLGSSAAAIVAGVAMANILLDLKWKFPRILDEAVRIEGHPDNVSACLMGSFVASAVDSGGMTRAIKLPISDKIVATVVVPSYNLPTKESRAVLPDTYSRSDVTHNIQRVALLVAGLATGDLSAFPLAMEDRIHQPYRSKLVTGLPEILRLRAPGLLGCVLSGAGPSVLVLHEQKHESVADLVRQIFAMNGFTTEIIHTAIASEGLQISV